METESNAGSEPRAVTLRQTVVMALRLRRFVIPLLPAALAVLGLAFIEADLILGAASMARFLADSFMSGGAAGSAAGPEWLSSPLVRLFQQPGIVVPVSGTVLLVLVSSGLGLFAERARFRISQMFRSRLQRELLTAFLRDSGPSRLDRDAALAQVVFQQDAGALGMFLIFGLLGFCERLVKLALYTAGLCRLGEGGWLLAVILIPAALVFKLVVLRLFLPMEQRAGAASSEAMIGAQRAGLGFFNIMSRLVLLGGERAPAEHLLLKADASAAASQRFQLVTGVHGAVAHLMAMLALPLSALLMARMKVTPGAVVQGAAIFQAILDCLGGLLSFPSQFVRYAPSLARVVKALESSDPGPRPPELDVLLRAERPPDVRADDLVFSYPGALPLLRGVSFEIPSGALVCITGASGSGKTTLAKLLTGECTPHSGTITAGGTGVTRWPLWWRRELFAFLPADTGLLAGTVEENVRFGRNGLTDNAVAEAIRLCGLTGVAEGRADAAMHAPDRQLSTGEQRRIGVARLLSGGQHVWILDEPLANLDPHHKRETADAIHRAAAGHTVIVLTHDPEYFRARFVIFVHDGVPVQGAHEELLASYPPYWHFYAARETAGPLHSSETSRPL